MSWGKYRKVQIFFRFDRKRSYKSIYEGNENIVTISCKIKCYDSARFIISSLSNLVNNLAEGIHKKRKKKKKNAKIVIVFLNMKASKIT